MAFITMLLGQQYRKVIQIFIRQKQEKEKMAKMIIRREPLKEGLMNKVIPIKDLCRIFAGGVIMLTTATILAMALLGIAIPL